MCKLPEYASRFLTSSQTLKEDGTFDGGRSLQLLEVPAEYSNNADHSPPLCLSFVGELKI